MGKEKQEVPGRRNLPTREEEETEFDQSEEEGPPPLSPRERECLNCKMFLCTHSKPDQLNIYDHLSHLLADILDERPDDPIAYFEDASRTLKCTGFREAKPQMHSPQSRTATETLSRAQFQLLFLTKMWMPRHGEAQLFIDFEGSTCLINNTAPLLPRSEDPVVGYFLGYFRV